MDTRRAFLPLAESIAKTEADRLEVSGKNSTPREAFIQQKTDSVLRTLENSYNRLIEDMKTVNSLLYHQLGTLPEEEKLRYQKEFSLAAERCCSSLPAEGPGNWRDFLGISKETLLFIYRTGQRYYEERKFKEAALIFEFLVTLDFSVSDFWNALGFTYRSLLETDKALDAFAVAAILNSENPTSRYQLADLYIHLGLSNDAAIEIDALSEIIDKNHMSHLQKEVKDLLGKIKK